MKTVFGYPLRLRTSTKLGYKNAKWIKAIESQTISARPMERAVLIGTQESS
jgi:DMSO/TMAO reductase YedYZ molybdopterin-dependent catalytic subunit